MKVFVYNTEIGRYVCNDYATAFAGKDIPKAFESRADAQRYIDSKHWMEPNVLTIHVSVIED